MNNNPEISHLVTKDFRLKIGESIKNFREQKGYSQNDLAILINVSRSTISKIENGKFAITVDYIERLAEFLDFDLHLMPR